MATCPSCQAPVDEEADLCLECGEPLGDSPAARIARGDAATPPPSAEPARVRAAERAHRPTLAASPKSLGSGRRRGDDEVEPVRCPGCGVPSRAMRCGGCGAVLRKD